MLNEGIALYKLKLLQLLLTAPKGMLCAFYKTGIGYPQKYKKLTFIFNSKTAYAAK